MRGRGAVVVGGGGGTRYTLSTNQARAEENIHAGEFFFWYNTILEIWKKTLSPGAIISGNSNYNPRKKIIRII